MRWLKDAGQIYTYDSTWVLYPEPFGLKPFWFKPMGPGRQADLALKQTNT